MVEEEGESLCHKREANYIPTRVYPRVERPCATSTEGYLKADKKCKAIHDVDFKL